MFRISRYVAAGGLLLAAVAWGNEDRYENTIHANVTYHGGKVQIDHKFGRVEVRTTGGEEVTVRGTVRASDEEIGKEIHFAVSNSNAGVSIRTGTGPGAPVSRRAPCRRGRIAARASHASRMGSPYGA